MSGENIKAQIEAIYEKRRFSAVKKRRQKLSSLYAQYPELKQMREALNDLNFAKLQSKLQRQADGSLADLTQQSAELHRKLNAFLQNHGIATGFDELQYECPKCADTGFLPSGEKCACRLALERNYKLQALSGNLDTKATFANFQADLFEPSRQRPEVLKLKSIFEYYCQNFRQLEDHNMIFAGDTGTGKTYLLHAIGNAVAASGAEVFYVNWNEAINKLKELEKLNLSYSPDAEQQARVLAFVKKLFNTRLLLLDELGGEITAYWTAEANMPYILQLLEARENDHLYTIIATNLSSADIMRQYDRRIYSRILGNYLYYAFPDGDVRINRRIAAGNLQSDATDDDSDRNYRSGQQITE